MSPNPPTTPSELSEQLPLAKELDRAGLDWFHVPNGGSRQGGREGALLKSAGVKAGVPGVLILSASSGAPGGTALELKRTDGTLADVAREQWLWLARFEAKGFRAIVAFGWRDAIERLRSLGYVF